MFEPSKNLIIGMSAPSEPMLFTLFCRLSSTLSLRLLSCHFIFTLSFWILRLNLATGLRYFLAACR